MKELRRLLILDPDFTPASPSMKAVLKSFPELRAAGFEIEGWYWQRHSEVHLDKETQIPLMGARLLGPLQALVYALQVSVLKWWRFKVIGAPPPDVIYTIVPYAAFCDVGHSQFSPWDWGERLRGMGSHSLRERAERAINFLIQKWMEFFLLRTTARNIIVPSDAVAADFKRVAPHLRITVLPNSYDPTRFNKAVRQKWRDVVRDELKMGQDEKVFVFVSTGHYRRKGFFLAVDAIAKVRENDTRVRLLVVGGQESTLERLRRTLDSRHPDWREWIVLSGSTAEPERYMAAADGFLFPSWSEALALVEVEAAACGLPLFLTRHHGSEMVLRDGVNGRLLEFDAEAIAEVLLEFVSGTWTPLSVELECGLDRQTFARRFTELMMEVVELRETKQTSKHAQHQ
jgi:glycosyltransferase involved in cell wall biosynthesis